MLRRINTPHHITLLTHFYVTNQHKGANSDSRDVQQAHWLVKVENVDGRRLVWRKKSVIE